MPHRNLPAVIFSPLALAVPAIVRGIHARLFKIRFFPALTDKIHGSAADIVLIRMRPAGSPSGHLYFGDRIKILRYPGFQKLLLIFPIKKGCTRTVKLSGTALLYNLSF